MIAATLLFSSSVFANQVTLPDLGGNGVKIYDGVNRKAWVYKDCKVTIVGSSKTKVIQVTIQDSADAFVYWTYSPTFASSPGFDAWSATASDNMNQVVDENTSAKDSHVYSNTSSSRNGGISSAIFRVSESTNALTSVEFNYHGQPDNREILCTDLVLRKK